MHVSEARLAANRLNALNSTGPRTAEGKEASRRNGLKHGLTGEGVVAPEGEAAWVNRRAEELRADLKPRSPLGESLLIQIATLSLRLERAGRVELAAIASKVRNAVEDFDQARLDRAEALYQALDEDPRVNLRKLRRMPEGVNRLLDAWRDLRDDLTREGRACWNAASLERVALLTGTRVEDARSSRVGALSRGVMGDFLGLDRADGGDLDEDDRVAWCRARLLERIDAEVAALEDHRETLDLDSIAQDRAEAPDRAPFDPGKEASLARRYEAAARRAFFHSLEEFRRVEADFAGREAAAAGPPGRLIRVPAGASVGSSCQIASPADGPPILPTSGSPKSAPEPFQGPPANLLRRDRPAEPPR